MEIISKETKESFRESLPVLLTSFINKSGDIGLRIFPMLLVEQHFSAANSASVMGLVRGSGLVSVFAGGILGDYLGHKRAILISFSLSAVGMAILTQSSLPLMICIAGMITAFGQGIFAAPLRLLLVQTVSKENRQVGLAWLRSGNNAAVMTANLVSYLTQGIGLVGLFAFDAVTSIVAVFLGLKLLPEHGSGKDRARKESLLDKPTIEMSRNRWLAFIFTSLLLCFFTGMSDLFFVSTAALAKISFGLKGISVFSQVYMLNTALCMLLTVKATKFFRNTTFALCLGFVLQTLGLLVLYANKESMTVFFFATLLQTFGELSFTSVATYQVMQILPSGAKEGRIYSLALLLQNIGKILGGASAFYFINGGIFWVVGLGLLTVLALGIAKSIPNLTKTFEEGKITNEGS